MELYTLDTLLRRKDVFDKYESFIWTERYSAYGDFQLKIASTLETRSLLTAGTKVATNVSNRVCEIKTVEDAIDNDGIAMLDIKGPSLEKILTDRVAKNSMSDTTVEPKWQLIGTPGAVLRQIFKHICVDGSLSPNDVIPFYHPGTILPLSTIPEPGGSITVELDIQSVYDAIKGLSDLYDLGFRLVRNFDLSQLYFDIYSGDDRTTEQTRFPAVVFSQDMDNLQNMSELTTIDTYKNVAYVFSPVGVRVVYPEDVDPSVEGFERRVLFVDASDITADTADPDALMVQKGLEELSKNRQYSAFDGEVNQHSQYKYGVDYNLGDLVEMRNRDGFANTMRVTEQIFVSDAEGERSYPTLSLKSFITPGSWAGWKDEVWQDMGTTVYWNNV